MPEYIVYRRGTNQANQGGLDEKPVLRLKATTAEEACRLASSQVALAEGQSLQARLAADLDAQEDHLSLRTEALPQG